LFHSLIIRFLLYIFFLCLFSFSFFSTFYLSLFLLGPSQFTNLHTSLIKNVLFCPLLSISNIN
jgi:hypothetical protein